MSYAVWLPDVARSAGIRFRVAAGWETRGGANLAPKGIVWHHTATTGPCDELLIHGRSDLAGPLANWSTHPDGSVSIIAAGTANHAGRDHTGNPLRTFGATQNSDVYGDEMVHVGDPAVPWPKVQLAAATAMSAAVCQFHGWPTGARIASHRSWAGPRKIDPAGLQTQWIQQTVTFALEGGNSMISDYCSAAYVRQRGYDPRQNGVDISGFWYWVEAASLEAPARHWTWADCQRSPTLQTMLVLLADEKALDHE